MTVATPQHARQPLLLVAAGTAALALGLAGAALTPVAAAWAPAALHVLLVALVAAGGLWLAILDARTHRLPNRIVLPFAIAIAGVVAALAIATTDPGRLLLALAAGAGMALVYLVLGLTGAVGFGDVKLAGALGIFLGWISPAAVIAGFVLAYVLATPHALVILIGRLRDRGRRHLPFGPYMIAGALLAAASIPLLGGSPS